jgi:hypothetical protein
MALTDSLKDKLLRNTGFFEGNDGYSTVSGNFDGQGISFGIIQYNFGQGTLTFTKRVHSEQRNRVQSRIRYFQSRDPERCGQQQNEITTN